MYTGLLEIVVNTINQTIKTPSVREEWDAAYARWNDPEKYEEYVTRRRSQEDLGNKLILGATGLAVAGEVLHIVKRSDVVKKIFKR